MRVPKRRGEEQKRLLAQPDDHFLTPATIQRMKDEIVRLLSERPAVIEDMQLAATQGDFSENAGYQSAKQKLRRINSRLDQLQDKINHAVPITKGSASGRVSIGSTVTVEAAGKEMTFEILGTQESDPRRGRISYVSPIGAALLDHAAGDVVGITVAGQIVQYRIQKVA